MSINESSVTRDTARGNSLAYTLRSRSPTPKLQNSAWRLIIDAFSLFLFMGAPSVHLECYRMV
jgi:hypothetical protein